MEHPHPSGLGKSEVIYADTSDPSPEVDKLSPLLGLNRRQRRILESQLRKMAKRR